MPITTFEVMYDCHVKQRITIAEVLENDWFKKGYQPPVFQQEDASLDDVNAIFNESTVSILVMLS